VFPYNASAANSMSNPSSGRTFCDNSYNASDAVNMVDWSRVYTGGNPLAGNFANYDLSSDGYQLYRYTQGLISLRKSSNAFRLPDGHGGNVTALAATGAGASTLAFGYQTVATDGTGSYLVFHNADQVAHSFTVATDLNAATLLVDGNGAGLTAITGSSTVALSGDGLTVTVAPLSSAVFQKS
jgi:pullulanase/glycogen debranching enzyme